MNIKKVKRAIISVSNKSQLKFLLPVLKKFNIEIISSGGSYKAIKKMKYECEEVSNYTEFSEMLDGRVKTLHPKIYAGILNIRSNKIHKKDLIKNNIKNIDLVLVDLYPFEKKLNNNFKFNQLIEYIDIGGPALIRAAAKNFNDVVVISNISNYVDLIKELRTHKGGTSNSFRKLMSSKAFGLTAYYDSIIANWLNSELNIKFPNKKTIPGTLIENLRYGENPHQEGSLYGMSDNRGLKKLHGKILSYNNYNDIYSALDILSSFKENSVTAIIKHANPCGVSSDKNQIKSFTDAFACDPISAFGGVIAINSIVSKRLALKLSKFFFEVILSKGLTKDALKILSKKKNVRLVIFNNNNLSSKKHYLFFKNSFLAQDSNNILLNKKIRIVSKKKASKKQIRDLLFAFNICKYVKSNAIVLANQNSTIGIGSGQPSRLDSCKIAADKAMKFLPEKILNSVAASDAFFPFPDAIKELIDIGVKAIIQPGGSIKDREVIKAADKAGIVMIFTGTRHFKH